MTSRLRVASQGRAASAKNAGADVARDGLCTLDLEGFVTWISDGEHPLFGRSTENVVGSPFAKLWSQNDHDRIARVVAAAQQKGGSRFTARAIHTGLWVDAIVQLRRDSANRSVEYVVTIAVADNEGTAVNDYMMLFNAAPVAIWTTHDVDAGFILGNPISEQRYRFKPGDNQSLSPWDGVMPENYRIFRDGREVPPAELPLQRAAKGEHVRDEDYELRLSDGSASNIIINASPMYNARGEIVGSVCVDIDITERRRIETMQRRFLECSRSTGQAFFEALVRTIAEALGACHVYIAECLPEDRRVLRSMAAWVNGKPVTLGDFVPQNTPCVDVLTSGEAKIVRHSLRRLFPDAPAVQEMQAEAYIGAPLHGADGQVIGIIGVMFEHAIDMSQKPVDTVDIFAGRAAAEIQRLRVEESLRQSEREYRIITDAIPALITFLDTDSRYRFSNAVIKSWFGVEPKDIKGKHISEVIGQQAFRQIEGYIKLALAGQRQKFETLMPYDGISPKHISAEYVPYIEDGRIRGFFALIADISEQKAGAEALRKSEAQFRTLFEHLPIGAALVDSTGVVQLENEVFTRVLPPECSEAATSNSIFARACTHHDADGSLLASSLHPARRALQGATVRDSEFICKHPDGRKAWVRMSALPIEGGDGSGEVSGALVVVADIHNEKRAEERRTLLLNELNHRVKNTLAGVQSIASQTFRSKSSMPERLEAFEERLLALAGAHDVLSHENWEGADLKQIVALVLGPHNPGGKRLVTEGPSIRLKPPAALAVAMALHELATNATKYGALSASTGTVRLSWKTTGEGEAKRLKLAWVERGGPPVVLKERGFGTRLIERSLAFELGSTSSIRFDPEGVTCEIDADFNEVTD